MPGQDFKDQGLVRQGQRSNQGHTMTLHSYNPQPVYQLSTPYSL